MELKLDIYTNGFCRKIEKTVTAEDFGLSVGMCEDVLNIINIDMFEGGIEGLSDETVQSLAVGIIKNGFPFFRDLVKELFEITDDEVRRVKIEDIAKVIIGIVKYSMTQLTSSLGGKNAKN